MSEFLNEEQGAKSINSAKYNHSDNGNIYFYHIYEAIAEKMLSCS